MKNLIKDFANYVVDTAVVIGFLAGLFFLGYFVLGLLSSGVEY